MKKIALILLALCLLGGIASSQETVKRKVAIYVTGEADNGYRKVVGSKLVTGVTRSGKYAAVERTSDFLAELMKEQDYQTSGAVSDKYIAKLGQQFGVRYVLVADISEIFESIFISARMIDVQTAEISASTETSGNVEGIDGLTKLADEIVKSLIGSDLPTGNNSQISSGSNLSNSDFIETAAGLNMKMIFVEGGDFLMGATSEQGSEADSDEQVIRRVKLDSYYIGECEVTQAQWAKIMGTSIYQQASKAGQSSTYGVGPDNPMYYVSWEEAMAFCRELSRMTGRTYCLPTEAQWEYAARGGKKADGSKYSGSWSIDAVAWYDGNSGSSTHQVKYKRPNGLGIYDMSGNVWEWCADWYSNTYNVNETTNPVGPSSGSNRVLRGGGWGSYAKNCRVASRCYNTPGSRNGTYGFRVVVIP